MNKHIESLFKVTLIYTSFCNVYELGIYVKCDQNNKIFVMFFSCISRLNCRPLGIIFFTILIAFSYKQLYPKARIQIPHEVQNNLKSLVDNFAQLRKDKPGAFCVIISGGLVTLAIAGHLISGAWLVMGSLIGILFLCAKYKVKVVHGGNNDENIEDDVNIKDTGECFFVNPFVCTVTPC